MRYLGRWGAALANLTFIVLAVLTASCGSNQPRVGADSGGGNGGPNPQATTDIAVQWATESFGSLPLAATLSIEPATYTGSASVTVIPVAVPESSERIRIDIRAEDAQGLTVLSVAVDYDPRLWHADGGQASGALTQDELQSGSSLLQLTGETRSGHLEHTQVLAPLDSATGFSGEGVLASLWLAAGPAKSVSAVSTALPRPQEVSYDPIAQELRWAYNLAGDYDQNGEVNTSDLVNLARNFGQISDSFTGFAFESIRSVVDGDGNGENGLGDLTVIGKHLGATLPRYEIFGSTNFAEYPGGPNPAPTDPGLLGGTAPYAQYDVRQMAPAVPEGGIDQSFYLTNFNPMLGDLSDTVRNGSRVFLSIPFTKASDQYVWVRARNGTNYGAASLTAGRAATAPPYGYPDDYRLAYDSGTQTLSWSGYLNGDYDANGEVNVADLNVIPIHMNKSGPFAYGTPEYIVDGTSDQVINMRDIRCVGNNFALNIYQGYDLFRVDNANAVPANPLAAEPGLAVTHIDGTSYDASANPLAPGWYYVRPVRSDNGAYGGRSNAVEVQ